MNWREDSANGFCGAVNGLMFIRWAQDLLPILAIPNDKVNQHVTAQPGCDTGSVSDLDLDQEVV